MKAVVQRVKFCEVEIQDHPTRRIEQGLLVLLGVGNEDDQSDADWLVKKIIQMRIFADSDDKMNLSLQDIEGEMMVVSQFTLFASTKKGNRPSFIHSAKPDQAIPLYTYFINRAQSILQTEVKTGEFGAMMKLNFINNGPVTLILDTKNKA